MATIKAFSDIEQSKKLAEILPLETADMCCFQNPNGDINYYGFPFLQGNKDCNPIPCWSLAALLGVLTEVSLNTFKDGKWNAMVRHDDKMIYEDKDNPIDACYALILKLHELNLL